MKIRYLKFKNWLLVSIMSLFGLSACHNNKDVVKSDVSSKENPPKIDRNQAIAMYGVPARDYQMKTKETPPLKDMPQAREPQVTVYGVPTVDFAVKGRVVDSKGKSVPGIQVTLINSDIDPDNLPETPHWKEQMSRVSDTTDMEGNFNVHTTDRPWETVRLMVRDIDGKKNGSYENQLVSPDFGELEQGNKPVSSWKLGEKTAEVTVELKDTK